MSTINLTYSQILSAEKEKNKSICTELADALTNKGFAITPRQVRKYKSGEVCPSYEVAVEINKILKISLNNSELLEVLNNSKEQSKTLAYTLDKNSSIIHARLTLRASDFTFLDDSDIDKNEAINLIRDRIKETYGDDRYSLNRYLINLIDKDMKMQ